MSGKSLTPNSAKGALIILQRLATDDLNLLIFDLFNQDKTASIDSVDDIAGDTQNAKALALLKQCQFRGREEGLAQWLKEHSFASNWEPEWETETKPAAETKPDNPMIVPKPPGTTLFGKPVVLVGLLALASVVLLGAALLSGLMRRGDLGTGGQTGQSQATLRVAFARGPISASTLMIRELRSGKEITLTRVGADTTDPTWSPDGQSIAASGGDGVNHDIVIYDVATGAVNRLTQPGNDIDPDWSRTDNRIYYVRGSLRDGGDIMSVKPNGSDVQNIGLKGRQPAISPDGSRMVYMQKHADGFWRIHIADTANWVDICVLSASNTSPTPNLRMPNWTNDSKGVVFNFADRAGEPRGLGYAELRECVAKVSSIQGTQALPPLGRPSCGGDFVCVVNQSAVTGGNLRLLKFDPVTNTFSDLGSLTPTRPQGTADFAPDVYP
ncbi:MAG: hypothetical protein HC853_19015 [Anaerolineae bacterium]|nr:hypothetical protein [Anaerolineae bacterium]